MNKDVIKKILLELDLNIKRAKFQINYSNVKGLIINFRPSLKNVFLELCLLFK